MAKKRNYVPVRVNDMLKAFILQYCEDEHCTQSDCLRHALQLLMATYIEGERQAAAIGLRERVIEKKKIVTQKNRAGTPGKRHPR